MSAHIDCQWVHNYLPLYLYHELSFEEEEALETHLSGCAACRAVLESERQLHAALDSAGDQSEDAAVPAGLLTACREQFSRQMAVERSLEKKGALGRLRQWLDEIRYAPGGWLRPAGAMALIAIGFFGGQIAPTLVQSGNPQTSGANLAETAITEPVSTRVRRVEPSGDGQLQVVVDETRQRVFSGSADDDRIRQLLLSAATDPTDAGLRGETLEILGNAPPSDDSRQALLAAVQNDANDGVRLRALEGLKPMARDSEVRRVLARVLLKDPNAGMRTQAIDLLSESVPGPGRENDIIGVFQDLMGHEQNGYIRMRAERQLQMVKASTQVY